MNLFNFLFLWAGLSIAIPIAIALWNRKQIRREDFGGFHLLRKFLQSTQKRIRLLELLKLLNRIAFLSLLILVFAEPLKKESRWSGAQEGFALILDVGRVMQAKASDGTTLIQHEVKRARDLLARMPSSSQGVILLASDRCDSLKMDGARMTATADQWRDFIRPERIAYVNSPTTSSGLSSCIGRASSLFEKKDILVVFISPLPDSLDQRQLQALRARIETLPTPEKLDSARAEIRQEMTAEKVRLIFTPATPREAKLIHLREVESLGEVEGSLDLPATGDSWLWLRKASAIDPWAGSSITSIQRQMAHQVTVWAQKESPGFLSLISALRNYPDMKVIRQVGGEPSGDYVIVYGSYPYSLDLLRRAWFFADPAGQLPFKMRDQKQWSQAASSPDIRRAFHIQTQDGEVFVRKYGLFDLDQFEIRESFQDGAPSLLESKNSKDRVWISPFDLEDLTTDLTLEPTFIPYLYRHLESWLSFDQLKQGRQKWIPVWSMPGAVTPQPSVLAAGLWPGVYGQDGQFEVVEPIAAPAGFLKIEQSLAKQELKEELVSLRPVLLKWLVLSLFIELFLCLASYKVLALMILMPLSLNAAIRTSPIMYFPKIDSDRKTALTQLAKEMENLSNLDFSKPQELQIDRIWESPVIVGSSTQSFGPFSREEREKIRDYCDRGGLLFFDDPLATGDSTFYRSVKRELEAIFPGRNLKSVPKDDVLFRTFYLLSEVSGRKLASPYIEGVELDKRWVAVFSFNDILGSQLRSPSGDFALSVSPYGIEQRMLAKRLFLNLMMYSLTVDYKDDAIHLPHILKRRAR